MRGPSGFGCSESPPYRAAHMLLATSKELSVSRNYQGSKCVSMTWRAMFTCPCARHITGRHLIPITGFKMRVDDVVGN